MAALLSCAVTFLICFQTDQPGNVIPSLYRPVAYTNRDKKYFESKYYNELVNMILRDSRWPRSCSLEAFTSCEAFHLVLVLQPRVGFPPREPRKHGCTDSFMSSAEKI